jgi:hypothetical protein
LTNLINGPLTDLAVFVNMNMGNIRDILNEVIDLIRKFGAIMADAFHGLTGGEGLKPLVDMLRLLKTNLEDVVIGVLKLGSAMILIKKMEIWWQLRKLQMIGSPTVAAAAARTELQVMPAMDAARKAIDNMVAGIEAGKASRQQAAAGAAGPGAPSGGGLTPSSYQDSAGMPPGIQPVAYRGGGYGRTIVIQADNLDHVEGIARRVIGDWRREDQVATRLRGPGHGPGAQYA